jgi:hypothetical protein
MADIRRFCAHAGKPLATVTLADLQSFADSLLDLAPTSRYRTLSAVKSLVGFGHQLGYLPFDVGRALRLPALRNRLAERILPEADVHRILSLEPKERNRALLMLLYASGGRVSEICDLRRRDVQANGDGAQITVFSKGGRTRTVQLPPSVARLLMPLKDDASPDEPVFRSRKGGQALQPVGVLRIVRLAAHRAGVELPSLPTGSDTRMPATLSTAAHRFISYRPLSAMPLSLPLDATCTPGPRIAPAGSSPCRTQHAKSGMNSPGLSIKGVERDPRGRTGRCAGKEETPPAFACFRTRAHAGLGLASPAMSLRCWGSTTATNSGVGSTPLHMHLTA